MTFWSHTKVLVTGANGFAGSSLCKQLVDNEADVYAMVRDNSNLLNLEEILPRINLVYGDVRYQELTEKAVQGKDYVFNLAAKVNIEETRSNPSETLRTNINGAFNVAQASKKYGVKRLIHVSTCHIYGNQDPSCLPLREDTIPRPLDVYSISKYTAEFLVRSIHGLDVVITRAFNHYGPGQTGDFLVAKMIRSLLNDIQPQLRSNKPTRDYSYVDDITRGYILSAEKGRNGRIYHFASGIEISVGELYDRICTIMEKDSTALWQTARENDMDRSCGNYERAKSELGWDPIITLEDGIRRTIEWWKVHHTLIDQNPRYQLS